MDFETQYRTKRELINKYLEGLYPEVSQIPEPLYGAMKYSLLSPGKRLRPVLMMSASEMFEPNPNEVITLAAAMEMIHTYSLIHDDLPAMDDDNLRRGRPTNHMIYGEGMAILAGDALLSAAFELILDYSMNAKDFRTYMKAAAIIARAAGAKGMVGGQCLDLKSEASDSVTEDDLHAMHRNKTGKMIEAAILAGAVMGGANDDDQKALVEYGKCIGLSFQIADDILDILGDAKTLGKPVGSDIDRDKLTFPKVYGLDKSKAMAAEYTEKAVEALSVFDERADFLRRLAYFMQDRES